MFFSFQFTCSFSCASISFSPFFTSITDIDTKKYTNCKDFSVWNEPSSEFEEKDLSPFWVGTSTEYEAMYYAVYKEIKITRGYVDTTKVRVGAAIGANDFSKEFLTRVKARPSSENANIDFVDVHMYPEIPSAILWKLYAKPAAKGYSIETLLEETGFSKTLPILIGEWSRQIPWYSMDIPGAAFVASSLNHLNNMHATNGNHNVECAFLYAVQKLCNGQETDCPDLNSATIMNWWGRMSKTNTIKLVTTGGHLPSKTSNDANGDELTVLAGINGDELYVLISHYEGVNAQTKPNVGECFDAKISLSNIPYEKWSWTHYANVINTKLTAVHWGCGAGALKEISVQQHENSFSAIVIKKWTSSNACTLENSKESDTYPASTLTVEQKKLVVAAQCGSTANDSVGLPVFLYHHWIYVVLALYLINGYQNIGWIIFSVFVYCFVVDEIIGWHFTGMEVVGVGVVYMLCK